MEKKEGSTFESKRGIQVNATKGQIVSAIFLIFVMLLGPILLTNYIESQSNQNTVSEVYTAKAIIQNNESGQGQVAGIYNDKTNQFKETASSIKFLLSSPKFFLIFAVAMFIIFSILTTTLIGDLLKN